MSLCLVANFKTMLLACAAVATFAVCSSSALAVDLGQIEKDLGTVGVEGWIHGSVKGRDLYVFTYRNPKDFFDSVDMSLVSVAPEMTEKLALFSRHDRVLIKGSFMDNPSPQKHVELKSIELIKKYQNAYPTHEYEHEVKIPESLEGLSRADFLVHAIAEGGHVLVVEYKDQVLPIYVKNADLSQDLFRNDVVSLSFHIQQRPSEPTHLVVNENEVGAVKVIDSIRDRHGKTVSVEGALVLFPKSPEIIFNVFAVQDEALANCKRQFTLLSQDPATFTKIRDVLQKAWDFHPGGYVNGRNKLISQKIRVRVTGTFNEINPGQANAQILLDSADSVKLIEK